LIILYNKFRKAAEQRPRKTAQFAVSRETHPPVLRMPRSTTTRCIPTTTIWRAISARPIRRHHHAGMNNFGPDVAHDHRLGLAARAASSNRSRRRTNRAGCWSTSWCATRPARRSRPAKPWSNSRSR